MSWPATQVREVRAAGWPRAMLVWALAHAPLLVLAYSPSMLRALERVPASFAAGIAAAWAVQALFLAALGFLAGLPLVLAGRAYPMAGAAVTGLVFLAGLADALLSASMGFHVNGLLLRALLQPGAFDAIGLSSREAALAAAGALVLLAADVALGARFVRRVAHPSRRAWPVALLLGLEVVALFWVGVLSFYGGPGVAAAGDVLPLQPRVSLRRTLAKWTGHPAPPGLSIPAAAPVPEEARDVRFTRRPDVVFALVESLPADFLDPAVMPAMTERARAGAVYARHYSSAASTHFGVFGLFFGLNAQRIDQVLASGRGPALFRALRGNGYRTAVIAASTVDWMGMRDTVFRDVQGRLETAFPGSGHARDVEMLARARRFVEEAGPEPLFLFLFFEGTHFNYTYAPESEVFKPCWNGEGRLATALVEPALVRNRARNAAHQIDRDLDALLRFVEQRRGRAPTLVFTSDHGEEFGERGRVGHGSDVSDAQIHVPLVVVDEGLEPGVRERVTSHIDLVPTLFARLGDPEAARACCDGVPLDEAPADRFVLATVGWEPVHAAVGADLKVKFHGLDAGLGGVEVTDPADAPVADAAARLSRAAPHIVSALAGRRR